jgi:hypothetical protein
MARSTEQNSWEGVTILAMAAGAKYPELVAAQWALESGWGQHMPGNNAFGLKGAGQLLDTIEVENGEEVAVKDSFLTFSGLEQCVEYLVDRWYKDWEEYKGVNRASSREAAARELQKQGYATNPQYATKLIELMKQHAGETHKTQSKTPVLFRLKAKQETVLKKEPKQATELGEKEQVKVVAGRVYEVEQLRELAGDAHAWVKLGHTAGSWFIWQPHWERVVTAGQPPEGEVTPKVDWADFGCLVTPHCTVGEVLQWSAARAPKPGSADEARILKTAQQFEKIRQAWGSGLAITSFYRPEPFNTQVGGVKNSKHITGEAVDLYPVSGGLDAFYSWLRQRWSGGLGDGRNRGFVHIDLHDGSGHFVPGAGVRPIREWDYGGGSSST